MILEKLSEATRRELDSLSLEQKRALAGDLTGERLPELDPVVREFLDKIEKGPLLDPSVDVVAMIREGRKD